MAKRENVSYIIKRVNNDFNWNDIEKAPINKFRWCNEYSPETYGQIVLLEDKEFVIKLTCIEKNPKAVYKKFGEEVWLDSCLEFFVAFDSTRPDVYMNCEMNSAGAAYMCIGKNEGERPLINTITGKIPEYKAEVLKDSWSVELHLEIEDIKKLFGNIDFKEGYEFTANMFKCGDETEFEHYGMWSECISEIPAFHLPQFFGKMIIG